jgi:hypothetical protein
MMKRILKYFTLLAAVIVSMEQVQATHVVGSDWSYECIPGTNGRFKITLVLYRDCQGIPLCPEVCGGNCTKTMNRIGADPSCNGTNFGAVQLQLVSIRDVNPNPRCPDAKSICRNMNCVTPGSFVPGVERVEFSAFVELGPASGIPPQCCNVRFTFSECCRNSIISTGSANANYFSDMVINRCLSTNPCNSSPSLTNDPFAVICSGQPFMFNNGAVDPDFDSLSYSFVPSLSGIGASVAYVPPFSFDRPMPWSGPPTGTFPAGIGINSFTGDIGFTPSSGIPNFVGVMAMQIQQWRWNNNTQAYELVGTTRRDIQVWLRVCPPNNPPTLRTVPGAPGNPLAPRLNWDVCAGDQLCFDIIAKDTDFVPPTISDTTYLSWNQALAGLGATFLPNYNPLQRRQLGPREDNFKFCWTPTENMGSPLPYFFTVKAEDSRCPLPGNTLRAFAIRVFEKADARIVKNDLKCGNYNVRYEKNIIRQQYQNVIWRISREPDDFTFSQGSFTFNNVQQTPNMSFRKTGKYLISLSIDMQGPPGEVCTRTLFDTITIDNPINTNVRDTFVCLGSEVTLGAVASNGQPPYFYRWYNNIRDTFTTLNTNFTQPFITVQPAQTRFYTVQVRDVLGCRVWDSIKVTVKPLPVGTLPDSSRICFGDTFTLDAGNNNGNIRRYLWSTGDTSRSIIRTDSNRYIVTLTDTVGCVGRDTMMLKVNARIIPFAGVDTSICFRDTATLVATGGQLYQWRNLMNGAVISPKSHNNIVRVAPTNTGTPTLYEVRVYRSFPDTTARVLECSLTDTVQVTVRPLPTLLRPQVVRACWGSPPQALGAFNTNQPGGQGTWLYQQAPGAIIPGPPPTVILDSLAIRPNGDTSGTFTNWIGYRYVAPQQFGGCTQVDSAQVVIHGRPRVNGGTGMILCDNGSTYEISTAANQFARMVTPLMPPGNSPNHFWSGVGIDSTVSSSVKRYIFNPARNDVNKLPQINVLRYQFNQVYSIPGGLTFACANSDTVQFNVIDAPDIKAGSNIVICKNNPIFNLTQASGGTTTPVTNQEYWTSNTPFIQNAISQRRNFNPAGFGVPDQGGPWRLYMRDTSTGCAVVDSINLTIAAVPNVTISFSPTLAIKDTLYCRNTGLKSVWTTVNGISSPGTDDPSDTNYSYIGVDAWAPAPAGIGAPGSFQTDNPNATASNQIIFRFVQFTAGIGCANADTALVRIQDPPVMSITPGGAICAYTEDIEVSIASLQPSIYSIEWATEPGSGTFQNVNALNTRFIPSAAARDAGSAKIYATTVPLGVCATTADQTSITIHKVPRSQILCDSCQGCEPLNAYFAAGDAGIDGPIQYKWIWNDAYNENTTDSSFVRRFERYIDLINGRATAKLVVSTTTSPTCFDTSQTQVSVFATPKAAFLPEPEFTTIARPFFDFLNLSNNPDNSALSYVWTFPSLGGNPIVRTSSAENPKGIEFDADTGLIHVFLRTVSEHGCWDTTHRTVRVEPDITVFIPNAFRPSSNINDCLGDPSCNRTFKPMADGFATIEVIVYNRWGQEVYRTTNPNDGWNGQINNNGEICPQDVYIYMIYATSFSGKQYKYSGSVTLLR